MPVGIDIPLTPLRELARSWGGVLDDPTDGLSIEGVLVDRVVPPEHASRERDLVPVLRARAVDAAQRCAGWLLCEEAIAARIPSGRRWVHPNATLAMARVLTLANLIAAADERERAVIDPTARLHPSVKVGAFAVIRADVEIGADSVIAAHAVIEPRTRIGSRVTIGSHAVIGRPGFGWVQDRHGVVRVPQLGGVEIEDDVDIGPFCTVDSGTLSPTRLKRAVKLDAHVHVGHNVEIGAGTIVAAQSGFAGSSKIGSGVMIGGQAGFADHVHVGDGARVAAKSGVIGDIEAATTVAGYPAIPRFEWLRAWAKLIGLGRPRNDPR
ncbi:MAG: UDP-3-O-(3-hydroxymyristoyl)glucosamine N-acyltransferase [Polyangiaceae bacterium]